MRDQGEPSYCRSAAVLLRDRRTDTCGRRAGIATNMRKSACRGSQAALRSRPGIGRRLGKGLGKGALPSRPPPGPRKGAAAAAHEGEPT